MVAIAGGIMLGGLVAGTFAPSYICIISVGIGAALAAAASWRAEQQERQAARKLAAYPSYKYKY